jgi:hypothetical protein
MTVPVTITHENASMTGAECYVLLPIENEVWH